MKDAERTKRDFLLKWHRLTWVGASCRRGADADPGSGWFAPVGRLADLAGRWLRQLIAKAGKN